MAIFGSFEFREDVFYGEEEQLREMESFVQKHRPYSKLPLAAEAAYARRQPVSTSREQSRNLRAAQ